MTDEEERERVECAMSDATADHFSVIPRLRFGQVTVVGVRPDGLGYYGRPGYPVHLQQSYAEFFVRLLLTRVESLVAPALDAMNGLERLGLVALFVEGRHGGRRVRRYKLTERGVPVAEEVRRALTMIRLGG